jgi:predicted dehydrogenase
MGESARKRLGIGLIGYGPYGEHLARMVLNSTRATIPMIWTRGPETAEKIRSRGFEATNDVDELINHPEVEAVIVASPNAKHKEHVLKVCKAGKALWAEKPLVLNLEDYDEIIEAVHEAGIVNHCNFGMRYRATCRTMIELYAKGEFGKAMHLISRSARGVGLYELGNPHKAVVSPELSGGWTMHHMCHQVDFTLALFKERIVRVYAQMGKSHPDCPSEETISAILTSESGAISELADGLTTQSDQFLSFLGSKAHARAEGGQLIFRGLCEGNYGHGGQSISYTPEGWQDDSMTAFISEVTGVPQQRAYEVSTVPINEGRHVLEILLAIKKSAETNQPVELG